MALNLRAMFALSILLAAIQQHAAQPMPEKRESAAGSMRGTAFKRKHEAAAFEELGHRSDSGDEQEEDYRNEERDHAGRSRGGPQSNDLADFQQKAKAFQKNFIDLGGDALKQQCQQIEAARQRGQQKWMEEQGFFAGLSKMCDAMKKKNPGKVVEVAREEERKAREAAHTMRKHLAVGGPKAVAMGCTSLLKAKNDGKMEWFESQAWYKKALKMCTNLADKTPEDLEREQMEGAVQLRGGTLKGKMPLDLLKESCQKLSMTFSGDAVRNAKWFPQAESMCVTVQSASLDELKETVRREANRAETASGQLIKQTCQKVELEKRKGEMKQFKKAPWYPALLGMCHKMGAKTVSSVGLRQKCEYIDSMKQQGKESTLKEHKWYQSLSKTCSWLEQRKTEFAKRMKQNGAGFDSPAAVFV